MKGESVVVSCVFLLDSSRPVLRFLISSMNAARPASGAGAGRATDLCIVILSILKLLLESLIIFDNVDLGIRIAM